MCRFGENTCTLHCESERRAVYPGIRPDGEAGTDELVGRTG
jgi:hypothetical protein